MAVKRIQLRGISRTPSDRMNADGGVAESINIRLDEGECAPMVEPKIVEGIPESAEVRPVYIHKTNAYTNYIGLSIVDNASGCVNAKLWYCTLGGDWTMFWNEVLELGETFQEMRSLGNILIMQTNQRNHYIIYKDNSYRYLGTKLPEPMVELQTVKEFEFNTKINFPVDLSEALEGKDLSDARVLLKSYSMDTFNSRNFYPYNTESNDRAKDLVKTISKAVMQVFNKAVVEKREDYVFCRPVFARYAVKLYDGTYVNISAPILLGCGLSDTIAMLIDNKTNDDDVNLQLKNKFKIHVNAKIEEDNWMDYVSSVDIFLSTDVSTASNDAELMMTKEENKNWPDENWKVFKIENDKPLVDELLSKSNFYLALSLEAKYVYRDNPVLGYIKPKSQDDLLVCRTLGDDFRSGHNSQMIHSLMEYNGRLLGCGVREWLPRGYRFLQSTITKGITNILSLAGVKYVVGTPNEYFKYKFYIRTSTGKEASVLAHFALEDSEMFPLDLETTNNAIRDIYYETPRAFITYPDSRCYKVDVYNSVQDITITYPMKPHPMLDCAYYFADSLMTPIVIYTKGDIEYDHEFDNSENRVIEEYNRVCMTDVDNPFVIPTAGRLTFGSTVLSVATTTTALSTGQYDQAPLYVFTATGIEAQRINADGSFSVHSFVSRDVAKRGSICPVDKAIIFSSDKGVMCLSGSQVECLSATLNGPQYALEKNAARLIACDGWNSFSPAYSDTEGFISFITSSVYAYDYAGGRLLCFNPKKAYQYVYDFRSGTWHTMLVINELFAGLLNSYPQTFICTKDANGVYKIMDFSTYYDANGSYVRRGMIVTRPFDLDESDVRKQIKQLKIRGNFNQGDVSYLLLGSMDGLNFFVLPSLRSGSFKSYRLVVLCELSPSERVSFVELDYEQRFTNKLR